jgi:hypothetical protein
MVRTQIQLTPDLHRALKRWASRRGISLSEAVRRCVASQLTVDEREPERETLIRDALAVVGKYSDPSGKSRVARDHDRVLDEAYRR